MIIVSILSFLFKKRMTFSELALAKTTENFDPGWEFILKIVKFICWYCIISIAYYSTQQPIGSNEIGFNGMWPVDSIWFCIDKTCDLVRMACQYRMNINWD